MCAALAARESYVKCNNCSYIIIIIMHIVEYLLICASLTPPSNIIGKGSGDNVRASTTYWNFQTAQ